MNFKNNLYFIPYYIPDDIIDYIYTFIYYKQNENLLLEIKLIYYINNILIKKHSLKDICSCAIIHSKNDNFINNISINDIDNIYNNINKLDNIQIKTLFNKTVSLFSLDKKYSFIFYMLDITVYPYTKLDNKYIKNKINKILKIN